MPVSAQLDNRFCGFDIFKTDRGGLPSSAIKHLGSVLPVLIGFGMVFKTGFSGFLPHRGETDNQDRKTGDRF